MSRLTYRDFEDKDNLIKIQGWARAGLTDAQIAHNMGVSSRSLTRWKKKSSRISRALKDGKEVVDFAVESALFKKAINGDTTAMIFWLKNRKPDEWRDRRETQIQGSLDTNPQILNKMSDEEVAKIARERLESQSKVNRENAEKAKRR